jgi:hypothetical protein
MKPDISDEITYVHSPWYDLIGMLWLLHNHPTECVVIPKGLLTDSGKIKNDLPINDWSQTTLVWNHKSQSFVIPPGFWEAVKDCLKKGSSFILIPMGFDCGDDKPGHQNFLIYNTITKEMERFEPNGSFVDNPCFNNRNNPTLTEKIIGLFDKHVQKGMIKDFYEPMDFCPPRTVQFYQANEGKKFKGEGGFCLSWSYWYADTRLRNPTKEREEVVHMALKSLYANESVSFTSFIRSFSAFLAKVGWAIERSGDPAEVFKKYTLKYT